MTEDTACDSQWTKLCSSKAQREHQLTMIRHGLPMNCEKSGAIATEPEALVVTATSKNFNGKERTE